MLRQWSWFSIWESKATDCEKLHTCWFLEHNIYISQSTDPNNNPTVSKFLQKSNKVSAGRPNWHASPQKREQDQLV